MMWEERSAEDAVANANNTCNNAVTDTGVARSLSRGEQLLHLLHTGYATDLTTSG